MIKKLFPFLFIALSVTHVSYADDIKKQCIKDAQAARVLANTNTTETYKNALIACNGPCAEACLTDLKTCTAPFETTYQTCVSTAESAFSGAITTCQTSTNCGKLSTCYQNVTFQTCLVQPRVDRRVAEAECQKAKTTAVKTSCTPTFKSCKSACK